MTTTPDLGFEPEDALEQPPARYGKPPSVRPALVVLACAVVVSVGGFVVALIGSGQSVSKPISGLEIRVPGVSIRATNAASTLRRITSDGSPPSDIVDSLVVPIGARIVSSTAEDAGVDQYDRSIYMDVDAAPGELMKFYKAELKRGQWSLLGEYPISGGASEVLGRRAGSDGYEWEVGVVLTPVTPAISPALAGDGQTSPTTGVRLRLFQIPDGGS